MPKPAVSASAGPDRPDGTGLPAAIEAASARPAAAIGLAAELERGNPADLVLLDDAGGVVRVMRRGEWIAN